MDSAITFGLMEKNFKDDINEQIWKLRSLLKSLQLTPKNEVEEVIEQDLVEEPIIQEQPKEIQPKEILSKEVKPRQTSPIEPPVVKKQIKKESFKELSSKEKPQKEGVSKEAPDRIKPLEEEPVSTIVLKESQLLENSILLVHSCDKTINQSVLEFVEKLEPRASILHGQLSGSRSIIEKLGEFSNINFAIFLFTPDDFAIPRDKPREKQIPFSQNVIFEFGYFVGKLGPGKVCALYKEGLEIPWDYSGAVCIPMDFRGGWRLLVAKEIKQAGIEIDLNKAI
jgi:predicted nucleotide-binding protein